MEKITEKMVKRQCALCRKCEDSAVMYIAKGRNLAVHQDCLLYSSGFVESEEPENLNIRFDVDAVETEIKRGKRLRCTFCSENGATVGCELKTCRRTYHYFCALLDDAKIDTCEEGAYRVFCHKHDPNKKISICDEDRKKERSSILMKSSSIKRKRCNGSLTEENLQGLGKKNDRHKVRIEFLKKCKKAGLLDEIFGKMLDAFHLAQEKLMDDNTSETEYEETVISLFDCGLFENVLATVHSKTEEKIQALLNTRESLDTQIKLLEDLKNATLPLSEDTASGSNSISE
uniref:PHD-type domain-containing protein n=1 Tax=Salvator merianae TaxID=96440 RepID=A0A8D0E6T8_SALMN